MEAMSTGKVRSLPSKINSKFILLIFQVHFILDFVNFDQDCCLFKFILFVLILNLKIKTRLVLNLLLGDMLCSAKRPIIKHGIILT